MQVVKRVMKLKEAEPFNAPVNPVALHIPVSLAPRGHHVVVKAFLTFGDERCVPGAKSDLCGRTTLMSSRIRWILAP